MNPTLRHYRALAAYAALDERARAADHRLSTAALDVAEIERQRELTAQGLDPRPQPYRTSFRIAAFLVGVAMVAYVVTIIFTGGSPV